MAAKPEPIELSRDLSLPLDAVTQKFAFLARSGAGKTYGATKLAEGMLDAGAQVVALDPVGVWWGLRLAADGKGKGIDIPVVGGLHGDIPLEAGAGELVADLVVDRGISVVLDVSMFRKGQRKEFATAFAEQLFHRKKERRSAVHLFVEEAQAFVPQRTMRGEERMLGAFEDVIKLGRNFGIGCTLISQRPQSVNKDVLNQTEALFVLQTNGSQERKALEAWIVEQGIESKDLVDELPGLPIGTAYLWSPSWLRKLEKVRIAKKRTYNASATPEVGEKAVEPRALAPVELEQLRTAMAETVKKAEAEDPRALRKRVAELEAQVLRGTKPETKVERVEVPVFEPGQMDELRMMLTDHRTGAEQLIGALSVVQDALVAARESGSGRALSPPTQRHQVPAPAKRPLRPQVPKHPDDLSDYAVHLLGTLASRQPLRMTRSQLAVLSNRSPRSSSFLSAMSELAKGGYIAQVHGAQLEITDAGQAAIGGQAPAPATGEEIRSTWLRALPGYEADLLRPLLEQFPSGLTREQLGAAASKSTSSSSFLGAISTLKKNDLIEDLDGVLSASPSLFPEAP